jgi:hypothetical protein
LIRPNEKAQTTDTARRRSIVDGGIEPCPRP